MLAIQTQNLSKTFGRGAESVQALKGINLEVPRGQVFGFLGSNGAEKTTTIRVKKNRPAKCRPVCVVMVTGYYLD